MKTIIKDFGIVLVLLCLTIFSSFSCKNEELSSNKDIISFALSQQVDSTFIDKENRLIEITVGSKTNISALAPEIKISEGATIVPASGDTVDFSGGSHEYTVTAEDGTKAIWKVVIKKLPSSDKEIISYKVDGEFSPAVITDSTVEVTVYWSVDITNIKPEIVISEGAIISPASGEIVNFKKGKMQYVVTAQDSSKKVWTVKVIRHPKISGEILNITVPGQTGEIIKGTNYSVVSAIGITDYTKIAPEFTLNEGVTSDPISGTVRDFSNGYADYTLTSVDGTAVTWRIYISGRAYDADNANIKYVGRIDFTNPKCPKFSAPGVYIVAKFKGSNVDVELDDQNLWGNYQNFFQVVIDNNEPVRYRTEKNKKIYRIAKGLSSGTHTLKIIKDTEAGIGWMSFSRLWVDELLTPDDLPTRKIECYGNSITCGYGIYSDMCDKAVDNEWYISNSAALSYGAIVAQRLSAQYQLTSVSGIGLVKSCCNMTYIMPDVYNLVYIDNSSKMKWDFSKYIPDVVTICLGQNDGIIDSAVFCSAYISFIDNLKNKYPDAHYFCLTSPMSDNNLLNFQKKCLSAIEKYYQDKGDNKVHKVYLTNNLNKGCVSHPDKNQHILIANEVETAIKSIMGW